MSYRKKAIEYKLYYIEYLVVLCNTTSAMIRKGFSAIHSIGGSGGPDEQEKWVWLFFSPPRSVLGVKLMFAINSES